MSVRHAEKRLQPEPCVLSKSICDVLGGHRLGLLRSQILVAAPVGRFTIGTERIQNWLAQAAAEFLNVKVARLGQ